MQENLKKENFDLKKENKATARKEIKGFSMLVFRKSTTEYSMTEKYWFVFQTRDDSFVNTKFLSEIEIRN